MARKRKSKPTTASRSHKQRTKDRYAHAREDAQLEGLIPTVPEDALKSERVDPATQSEQRLAGIDRDAIRRGWAVPEEKKALLVDRLIEPFLEPPVVVEGPDGSVYTVPPDRNLLKENFKALVLADKFQHEVDHPEDAGKAKGGVNVGVEVNNVIDLKALFVAVDQQREQAKRLGEVSEYRH